MNLGGRGNCKGLNVIRIDSVLPLYIAIHTQLTGKSSAIFVRYASNGDLSMNSFTCIVQRVITCMVGSLLVAMSTFYDGNDIHMHAWFEPLYNNNRSQV